MLDFKWLAISSTWALVVTGGCAGVRRPPALWFERSRPAVHFETTAGDVRAVELIGGAADAEVEGTADSTIVVDVSLRSTDTERLRSVCLVSSRLDTATEAGVLRMALRQQSRNKCGETWRVRVPAALAARVRIDVGKITLRGITGGVYADVINAGDITGSVGGDIDVTVGVGDIRLHSIRGEYGLVELTSSVGAVQLTIGGYKLPAQRRSGAGGHIRVTGRGDGQARARSRVGDVEMHVASQGVMRATRTKS